MPSLAKIELFDAQRWWFRAFQVLMAGRSRSSGIWLSKSTLVAELFFSPYNFIVTFVQMSMSSGRRVLVGFFIEQ